MLLSVYSGNTIDYDAALAIQERLVKDRIREKTGDALLLQEHPPTLTIGRNGLEQDILLDRNKLEKQGVIIRKVSRGGDVTYHGPGQLVAYPVIHLYKKQRSLRSFVEKLEQVIIDLLKKEFGLEAERNSKYRGVWIGNSKIAALGISVHQAVTMHGIAFNVQPDLSHFSWIIPCGIRDRGVTSLQQIIPGKYDMQQIKELFIRHFCQVFGYDNCQLHDYKEVL